MRRWAPCALRDVGIHQQLLTLPARGRLELHTPLRRHCGSRVSRLYWEVSFGCIENEEDYGDTDSVSGRVRVGAVSELVSPATNQI